jgi:cystathionine beta-synthase
LFVKLESFNPGGSIKDRIALAMIERAERQGKIKPGGTLVEATAGNTGVALVQIAILKGYKVLLVIPDKMSKEKISFLMAMGADIVITRSDVSKGHPEYYQDMAKRLASEMDNAVYIDQFENPANPKIHEEVTGPEIWTQMQHELDAIVCGVGTGGHLTGIGHYMKKNAPHVKMILADPEGSILTHYIKTGQLIEKNTKWLVEGIGEDYIPSICDLSVVDDSYTVTDAQSFAMARRLLKEEAIFGGSSSGTVVHAAVEYCRKQTQPKRVLTFIYDSGNKYMSKMYNDDWMKEHLRFKLFQYP